MEGVCVYTQLTNFVVQQKLTQYCKVFILQYGEKKKYKNSIQGQISHQEARLSIP